MGDPGQRSVNLSGKPTNLKIILRYLNLEINLFANKIRVLGHSEMAYAPILRIIDHFLCKF